MNSRRFNRCNCIQHPTSQGRIVRRRLLHPCLHIALGPPCLQRATAARLQAPIPLSNLHFSRANWRQVPISTFWPAVAFCAKADSFGAATRMIVVANALKKTNVCTISSLTNGKPASRVTPKNRRARSGKSVHLCSSPRATLQLDESLTGILIRSPRRRWRAAKAAP
jgi:hypothetical protein